MSEGADPTARIADDAGGQWLVVTESSTYLFDLDGRTATRYPGTGPAAEEDDDWLVADLRRDGEPISLIGLDRCQVGERLIAVLDIRRDGVVTVREATIVVTISFVNPEPGHLA